jgi:PucR C-terminal helix-turn-helix domain/GGDEF-like domain
MCPSADRDRGASSPDGEADLPRPDEGTPSGVEYRDLVSHSGVVPTSPSAEVLRGLAEKRDAYVALVVAQAAEIEGYAQLDAAELADLAAHVGEGFDAVLQAIADQRQLSEDDVPFLWPHIHRRAVSGVPEGDMLAVVRIFLRVVWDGIVELADEDRGQREAALILARPLLGYIDVLSDAVDKAFLEAGTTNASQATAARSELLEALLAGAPLEPGLGLNTARAVGLEPCAGLLVIVARAAGVRIEATELGVAARLLGRAAGRAIEPLAVVRGDELVVVIPIREEETPQTVERVRTSHARLGERGLPLSVGMSTVHDTLEAVPAAYGEGCMALEHVGESGGVLALSGIDLHDYLILRAGDRTAWRLVPAAVRRFIEVDAGCVLCETLLAYADCSLSVKLAAARLYVHPNTVHYRLAKIEAQTGLDVRRLRDVQLLMTAIHLSRSGHCD